MKNFIRLKYEKIGNAGFGRRSLFFTLLQLIQFDIVVTHGKAKKIKIFSQRIFIFYARARTHTHTHTPHTIKISRENRTGIQQSLIVNGKYFKIFQNETTLNLGRKRK